MRTSMGHKDCMPIPVSRGQFFPQSVQGLQYMFSLSSAPSVKD